MKDHLHIISDLLWEVCTEIDLHYDDKDFPSLGTMMFRVASGIAALRLDGIPVPEVANQMLAKYERAVGTLMH
ncbi:hypothetical protein [Flaviflagellibacter deserti]|uniref:Uncharacterized protein n=1 Tax=Flaviflagellibacter deserti TaxID=2267266 RepID=A0ABV9YWN6_9HYPH